MINEPEWCKLRHNAYWQNDKVMEIRILKDSTLLIIAHIAAFSATLSCVRLPNPDFTFIPHENIEAGDTIWFFNESSRAESFEWDFGDSETSIEENPIHIYKESAIREVKLNAFNEKGKNFTTQSITINEPTILGFTIYNDSGSIPLPSASIWVYETNKDLDSTAASIFFGITDNEGYVEFTNAEPLIYYVDVIKVEQEGRWIKKGSTSELMQNELNLFAIKCEWISNQ